MSRKRVFVIFSVLAGFGLALVACDQAGDDGHMTGAGMMGGGMMRQMPIGNHSQPGPEQGAQLFQRYCGQCHAPPATTAHTAQEWLEVVARMQQHMENQGKAVPDNDQLGEIIDYLQRHAG